MKPKELLGQDFVRPLARYIATVWSLSAAADAVYGHAGITRRVVRGPAENERQFEALCCDRFSRDVDDEVTVGPIGLTKSQELDPGVDAWTLAELSR